MNSANTTLINNHSSRVEVVKPTVDDLGIVLQVEKSAWPDIGDGMVAEQEKFATRLELGLMYLLYFEGKPAGIISYQNPAFTNGATLKELMNEFHLLNPEYPGSNTKPTQPKLLEWNKISQSYDLPSNWYDATNNGSIVENGYSTHYANNTSCVFLIGVGVDSSLSGHGLVNYLINYALTQAKIQGATHAIGYGRLPQLSKKQGATPDIKKAESHLIEFKPGTNAPADYGARFHFNNGAVPACIIPNAMDDPESSHYGFLALYNLK